MAYQLEYRTADGKLIETQRWRPRHDRPEQPLIGDVLELVHTKWTVIDYALMSVPGRGVVMVEPLPEEN